MTDKSSKNLERDWKQIQAEAPLHHAGNSDTLRGGITDFDTIDGHRDHKMSGRNLLREELFYNENPHDVITIDPNSDYGQTIIRNLEDKKILSAPSEGAP